MSDVNSKVIDSFGERLAVDQAVRALADAANAYELEQAASALAERGDLALAALVRHLDTRNPKLRGGLGLLAGFLGR